MGYRGSQEAMQGQGSIICHHVGNDTQGCSHDLADGMSLAKPARIRVREKRDSVWCVALFSCSLAALLSPF